MPRADYRCPDCGIVWEDLHFSSDVGAAASAPCCPSRVHDFKGERLLVRMEVIPSAHFDLKTDGDGDRGFQKFDVTRVVPTRDGQVQVTETIDSLHKLRRIEADSEQRYRNGEGEPLRFRGYAQDRSNMDVGSFGREGTIGGRAYDSGKTPQKKPNISVTRHGQQKPRVAVAKGGGVSAL